MLSIDGGGQRAGGIHAQASLVGRGELLLRIVQEVARTKVPHDGLQRLIELVRVVAIPLVEFEDNGIPFRIRARMQTFVVGNHCLENGVLVGLVGFCHEPVEGIVDSDDPQHG